MRPAPVLVAHVAADVAAEVADSGAGDIANPHFSSRTIQRELK